MIYHSWINNLSGWDRTWKFSGLTGNRTLTCEMTRHNALSNQAIWRAGHWEIVTCPLVEMTWMEIYEMTHIYFELRNNQKNAFGCLRYKEFKTRSISTVLIRICQLIKSHIHNSKYIRFDLFDRKISTKLFLWKEDVENITSNSP